MSSKHTTRLFILAVALVVAGGGCLGLGKRYAAPTQPTPEERKAETAPEQADIIVDSLIEGVLEEEGVLGDEEDDALLYDSDEQNLSNYADYDEREF